MIGAALTSLNVVQLESDRSPTADNLDNTRPLEIDREEPAKRSGRIRCATSTGVLSAPLENLDLRLPLTNQTFESSFSPTAPPFTSAARKSLKGLSRTGQSFPYGGKLWRKDH